MFGSVDHSPHGFLQPSAKVFEFRLLTIHFDGKGSDVLMNRTAFEAFQKHVVADPSRLVYAGEHSGLRLAMSLRKIDPPVLG